MYRNFEWNSIKTTIKKTYTVIYERQYFYNIVHEKWNIKMIKILFM